MKINKGFSLIEVITVVAIIGVLTMLGYPSYKTYILRVESAKVLNDMSIIIREMQVSLLNEDFGGSEYSADKLLKLAPGGVLVPSGDRCAGPGYKLLRIQWSNPADISKILGNSTTKIKMLDIDTYKKDNTCQSKTIDTTNQRTTIFVRLDYEGYGFKLKNPNPQILGILMGGNVEYLDKQGKFVRKIDGLNNIVCYTFALAYNVPMELPTSAVPAQCRYGSIQTMVNGFWAVKLLPL